MTSEILFKLYEHFQIIMQDIRDGHKCLTLPAAVFKLNLSIHFPGSRFVDATGAEMSDIKVQLPDGSVQEVPQGTTPLEIARSISPRLADAALVARTAPLEEPMETAI